MTRRVFVPIGVALFLFFPNSIISADGLQIKSGDAYIENSPSRDGFDLYIRAASGLGSVLITESTADPAKKADSFAFRAWDYNSINGDERRILDGDFIESFPPLYFLLDSSPEPNEILGSAYRIYVPFQLTYGYSWSREGQVEVRRGTWLNIRAFERPFADYAGRWRDNPFILSMESLPEPELEPIPDKPVKSIEEAMDIVTEVIALSGGDIDIVLVVDTTVSMKKNVRFIREYLIPMVRNRVSDFSTFRIGLVLYRDYKEAYLTRAIPFTGDLNLLQSRLDNIGVSGGRDLQEAVNEGIYAALTEFEWKASERAIIQIGDAPAHEEPRGAITKEMIEKEAQQLGVSIHPFQLPNDRIR